MAKITIKRRNEAERKDGRAALYAVINIERTKIRLPLDISVTRKEWDPEKERIKGNSAEARDKNLIILNTKARISDILVWARLTGEALTKSNFLAIYHNPGNNQNFNEYAAQHLEALSNALQPGTIRHHQAALKKLKAFAPDLMISDVTADWLKLYAAHLRKHYNNNPGTIRKNMCVIRMHYYAAMRAGKAKINPFDVYKLPAADPQIVYLTEVELNSLVQLYNSETLPANEQDALRFFLFMTFTGMHISDARALQIEQIFAGEIHYRRVKTRIRVNVPLSKASAKLIDYYKGNRMRGNLIVSLPCDQAFNRLIKRVSAKANIQKPVSAKAARHTFATIYLRKNSGDLPTLSKMLGHVSINTTMSYSHITKDSRLEGIRIFDDML